MGKRFPWGTDRIRGLTLAIGLILLLWADSGRAEPEEKPPLEFVPGSTTLAVLPDTQVYTMLFPKHFEAQTDWIVENRDRYRIAGVLHLGDIVNNNNPPQWKVAQSSLRKLDGVVPYFLAAGNHDYGPSGNAATRETLLNEYFPFDDYAKAHPQTFGGAFEKGKLDNTYHTLKIGDQDWLILALEWGPRDSVVDWADQIVDKHPGHNIILITHAYLYYDDARYDHEKRPDQKWNPHSYGTTGGVNDGEQLWQKLVRKHPGFMMTLNGHVLGDGLGYLLSQGDAGNDVHQILANYQMQKEGGEAYLRLLEFLPDGETVQVKTYSPHTKKFKTDPGNQFVLKLKPAKS